MWSNFGWWGPGFGPLFMVLFWGAIIFAIVVLIRSSSTEHSSRQTREKTALEIVQERYARGQIDRQEYEQKMQDLEKRA